MLRMMLISAIFRLHLAVCLGLAELGLFRAHFLSISHHRALGRVGGRLWGLLHGAIRDGTVSRALH